MLNERALGAQRSRISSLLTSTERPGMNELLAYMVDGGFFTSPASTRYHGCYEGGLAKHSLGVFDELTAFNNRFKFGVDANTITITTLLHDLCKMGAYRPTAKPGSKQPYSWNPAQPKGHALLSLLRIVRTGVELTELEESMIRYHMGIYGSQECMGDKGEFKMRPDGMFKAWNKFPIVRWMYFSDEAAANAERVEEDIKH